MKAHLQNAVVCLALLAFAFLAKAHASPLFSIGEGSGTSWSDAIKAGNVVPVLAADGMTKLESDFYANEALVNGHDGFQMRDAFLTPDLNVSDGFDTHQAMVMAWQQLGTNDPGNDFGDVAAWEYVYDIDPDLTGLFLSFSLLANNVWDVSVELIDNLGRTKGWIRPGPPPNWQNALIDLSSNAANQGGFLLMPITPGFDITMVTTIRFDESGIWSMPFAAPPAGTVFPPGPVGWNAWNHVAIIPEPSALVLAAAAALCSVLLVGLRRVRRK
jgi:hypothetical protein